MNWKLREAEIARLRLKYKKEPYRAPFPDLKVKHNVAQTSDKITYTPVKPRSGQHKDAKKFPVGHNHKQGLELITPKTDLQYMGGKKPN